MRVRGNSARFELCSAILVRLCLLLSLWQAPVPWLHNHGTKAVQTVPTAAISDLPSHLAAYHGAVDINIEQEFGWHCHWVLPSWKHALDDTPDDEPPAQEPIVFDPVDVPTVVEVSSSYPLFAIVSPIEPQVVMCVAVGALHHEANGTFHARPHNSPVLRC